ncbi:hypothetical protein J32TS2_12400 [Shouchella clausii]|nr:hypothetical protein J1TS1_14720 [Shouchella clausii]GIN15884.1 hypothetical protein J32TS2_12400 [Shouchella clausii]
MVCAQLLTCDFCNEVAHRIVPSFPTDIHANTAAAEYRNLANRPSKNVQSATTIIIA